MLITDPILSRIAGYPAFSKATPIIYFSILLYVALGRTLFHKSSGPLRIAGIALLGSIQFFVVTNFFEWWAGISMYPHTIGGLSACYIAALPFFSRTLMADLFYTAILFAAHAWFARRFAAARELPTVV